MSKEQIGLIQKAKQKYGSISPCDLKKLSECFSIYNGKLYFWFNTSDNSTHAEICDVPNKCHSCK